MLAIFSCKMLFKKLEINIFLAIFKFLERFLQSNCKILIWKYFHSKTFANFTKLRNLFYLKVKCFKVYLKIKLLYAVDFNARFFILQNSSFSGKIADIFYLVDQPSFASLSFRIKHSKLKMPLKIKFRQKKTVEMWHLLYKIWVIFDVFYVFKIQ